MEKKVLFILLIILIGGFVLSKKFGTKNTQTQSIKLGAIYDFTGVFADGGKAFQEGTQIAVDEINAAGGIQGKKLEVIYEDDPDQTAKPAINAAQKLIGVDKVSAIMTISFSAMGGLQPLAEQNKIPILDTIDGSDKIGALGDWTFGTGIYTEGQGNEMANFAVNELNLAKTAILAGKDEYLLTAADAFEKKFKDLGRQITEREEFLVGEKDFRAQLSKIINSGAEAIFISHLGEGGVIIKQANELGFKGYFLGTDTMSIADVQRAAGKTLDNRTFFVLWRNFDQFTESQENFAKKYQAKFGKKPGDYMFYNVLGYDGLMVLAEAIKNSDLSGESIKNELYRIQNFPGLSGAISIDQTGINRDSKAAIVMYKNGKIVKTK